MNGNRFIIIIALAVLVFSATVIAAMQLPQHKFNPSSRPGLAKAQVRAIVAPKTLTQAQFMQTAVDLCQKYKSRATGSFLVQFFSSPACLAGWDGTGLLGILTGRTGSAGSQLRRMLRDNFTLIHSSWRRMKILEKSGQMS